MEFYTSFIEDLGGDTMQLLGLQFRWTHLPLHFFRPSRPLPWLWRFMVLRSQCGYVMVKWLMILIIMTVKKNIKNGIAINHMINTATKGRQAAVARNSSCSLPHFYN